MNPQAEGRFRRHSSESEQSGHRLSEQRPVAGQSLRRCGRYPSCRHGVAAVRASVPTALAGAARAATRRAT